MEGHENREQLSGHENREQLSGHERIYCWVLYVEDNSDT